MRFSTALLRATFLASALLGGTFAGQAQPKGAADPYKVAPTTNWLNYGGDYYSQHYSGNSQINTTNASKLVPKWIYHLPANLVGQVEQEQQPIVYNGVMYLGMQGRVDAIDARSGNLLWRFKRTGAVGSRGTSYYQGMVYTTTPEGQLIALDARNGSIVYETKFPDGYAASGDAPLVAGDKLIVSGNRPNGFITGFDAKTGKVLWTWSGLPKQGEPGYDTWIGSKPAGAPIWVTGSYDPELGLVYYGTGQPNPEWTGIGRMGDNLYSDSIVALDVNTGKMKWYFQNTPHDTHDWDSMEIPVLIDANIQGKPRKLLIQANRNGMYYVLDRTDGKFVAGGPFVKVDWTSGLDANGHPKDILPGHDPSVMGSITCPSTAGGTNWPSPSYSPQTKYFYVTVAEGCGLNDIATSTDPNSSGGYAESPTEPWQAYVYALDAVTGKLMWKHKQVRSNHYGPGIMATAGGILFAPEQFGQIVVLDAKNGKVLWHFNSGDLITAGPASYMVDGKQYLAIESNTNLIAFALPDAPAAPAAGSKP